MKTEISKFTSSKGVITTYKLTNNIGASVTLSSVGAGIVSVIVPDSQGNMADVVLGYADVCDYLYDGPCAGKIAGRFANRIANGELTIDGTKYALSVNCGPNHLHGGPEGFQNQIWESQEIHNGVKFTRMSRDGEENYPGNLYVEVEYTWNDDCELAIKMTAETDKKTVVNLTNHAYFNLDGENCGSILDDELWLNCSKYLPTDESLVPDGTFASVDGTPMDFRCPMIIGTHINSDFLPIVYGKGYDNCWAIDNWEKGKLQHVARLVSHKSGRVLDVSSTQPAVQVYTGNWLSDSPTNKQGNKYSDYDGIAIECQAMPDAPNKPTFPSTFLAPGEKYEEIITYKFSNNNTLH